MSVTEEGLADRGLTDVGNFFKVLFLESVGGDVGLKTTTPITEQTYLPRRLKDDDGQQLQRLAVPFFPSLVGERNRGRVPGQPGNYLHQRTEGEVIVVGTLGVFRLQSSPATGRPMVGDVSPLGVTG